MPIRTFFASRKLARASAQGEKGRLGWRRRKTHTTSRVVIRKPPSWRSRLLWAALLAALALAGGYGLFTAGQLSAGYSSRQAARQIEAIEDENAELLERNETLLASGQDALTRLQIEHGARQTLENQVRLLEKEHARLSQDLALFENLFPASGVDGVPAIRGFRIEPVGGSAAPGLWRYRVLVMRAGQPEGEFVGDFKLLVRYRRNQREFAAAGPEAGNIATPLRFQRYQRIEGQFRSPEGAVLLGAMAKVEENGRPVTESVYRN